MQETWGSAYHLPHPYPCPAVPWEGLVLSLQGLSLPLLHTPGPQGDPVDIIWGFMEPRVRSTLSWFNTLEGEILPIVFLISLQGFKKKKKTQGKNIHVKENFSIGYDTRLSERYCITSGNI